jgi:hypothetical protein
MNAARRLRLALLARSLRERGRCARALHLHVDLGSRAGWLGAGGGARALGGPPARAARARGVPPAALGLRGTWAGVDGYLRPTASAPEETARPAIPRRSHRSIPAISAAAGVSVRARSGVGADRRLSRDRAGHLHLARLRGGGPRRERAFVQGNTAWALRPDQASRSRRGSLTDYVGSAEAHRDGRRSPRLPARLLLLAPRSSRSRRS